MFASIISTILLWAGYALVGIGWCVVILLCYFQFRGMKINATGQEPFDARACEKAGYRHIEVEVWDAWAKKKRKRHVAYLVFGSQKADAKVSVFCHGSGLDALAAKYFMPEEALLSMNVKIIAPDLPGHGFTCMQKARRIRDWPKDDLEPILAKEGVERFVVQGFSFGTAHALACGVYFPKGKCVGVGLNGPFLDIPLCDEIASSLPSGKFRCDARGCPKTSFVDSCHGSWCLAALCWSLGLSVSAPWLATLVAPEMSVISKDKEGEGEEIYRLLGRGFATAGRRGLIGLAYEDANYEVCGVWGFDPRALKCRALSVWYAQDDNASPPEHGRWLAEEFGKQTASGAATTSDLLLEVRKRVGGWVSGCLNGYEW